MPKKNKKDSKRDPAPAEDLASALPSETVTQPAKRRAPSAKRISTKTAAKKKSPPRAKTGTKQPSKPSKAAEPSDADISLRAYFIAERRAQLGLLGDQANDWLEAKRQLLEEARAKES